MSKKKPDVAADIHTDEVAPATKSEANEALSAGTVALVRMTREGKTANVHPDERANYAAYGWQQV